MRGLKAVLRCVRDTLFLPFLLYAWVLHKAFDVTDRINDWLDS
jgi:hypothetical protein